MAEFERLFGRPPQFAARAPGRVNLIGEHTDYNGGFVFPAAIDREIFVVAGPADGESRWISREAGEESFRAGEIGESTPRGWARYGAAMIDSLGIPVDLDVYVASTIPMGSGVSSSAAIEMAFGHVLLQVSGRSMSPEALALAGQRGENRFVGVNCGIMDQMATSAAHEGHAMFLDTRSLEIAHEPIPAGTSIVLLDTKTPRTLAGSAYNERRAQCEEACGVLGVDQLRDASLEMLVAAESRLDPVVFRRARHVVTEDARSKAFRIALREGDAGEIGRLMAGSHASLRDDYEVSSPALDAMTAAAQGAEGVVGARMTGAGFGGCCVALCETVRAEAFASATLARYAETTGSVGEAMVCAAVAGASDLPIGSEPHR